MITSKFYNNLGKLEIESILVRSCIDNGPELFTTTAFEHSKSTLFAFDVSIWDNCPSQNLWNFAPGVLDHLDKLVNLQIENYDYDSQPFSDSVLYRLQQLEISGMDF